MSLELRDRLQASLGGAYQLDRELGGGGMSRVFVAQETALDRRIVIKVLPPELTGTLSIERFRREIQLAARVHHPHVVPVLLVGQADGLLYYTMPYIEGESLRERLDRDRKLPMTDILDFTRDIADALGHAHALGVIHRDVKPENILLVRHHALVTDFGVAKALRLSRPATERRAHARTPSHGMALGTPAYMAPEQVAADPTIDHRADIYALGCVTYEMLAGRPPFAERPAQKILAAHVAEKPVPVSFLRADVSPALEKIVMRCLAKNPDHRWQNADALADAIDALSAQTRTAQFHRVGGPKRARLTILRASAAYIVTSALLVFTARIVRDLFELPEWVPATAMLLAALALPVLVLTAYLHRGSARTAAATTRGDRIAQSARRWLTWRTTAFAGGMTIAVFAITVALYVVLRSLGVGPAASLLAAGVLRDHEAILVSDFRAPASDSLLGTVVTEALRTDLGQSRVVTVVQPARVRDALVRMQRPPGTRIDLELGREIAVREGFQAVVGGEVASVGTGWVIHARLIATATDQTLADVRESAANANDVIPAIERVSKRLRARIGESLRTVRSGARLEQVTTSSLPALRSYSAGARAIDVEGEYARGIALLEEAIRLDTGFAMAYRKLGTALRNRGEDLARADAMLEHAYRRRDRLPVIEQLLATGSYHMAGPGMDHDRAVAAYRSVLDLAPEHRTALVNLGVLHSRMRDVERAEVFYQRALAADPSSSVAHANLISVQLSRGKVDDAEQSTEAMQRRFPNHPDVLLSRVAIALTREQYERAESLLRALDSVSRADAASHGDALWWQAAYAAMRSRANDAERLLMSWMTLRKARGIAVAELELAIALAMNDVWVRRDTARAARRLDSGLARTPLGTFPAVDRPYAELAAAMALTGRSARAAALLADDERVNGRTRRDLEQPRQLARGEIALAERRYGDATSAFHVADIGECTICALPGLARAHEGAGRADSAIVAYERYLAQPYAARLEVDRLYLAFVLARLEALHERQGNTDRADHVRDRRRRLVEGGG